MTTGERIKNIRKSKGLSQEQLAKLCGLNRNSIYNYETGKRSPKSGDLERIADALEVTPIELLLGGKKEVKKVVVKLAMTTIQLKQLGEKGGSIYNLFNQYGYSVPIQEMINNKEAIEEDFRRYVDYIYHSYFTIPNLQIPNEDEAIENLNDVVNPNKEGE